MFRNKPFAFIATLALCSIGIGIIIFITWFIRTLRTTLIITSERTIIQIGLSSKITTILSNKDVSNITISQSRIQRLLNVGSIQISSARQENIGISIKGILDPKRVRSIIEESKVTENTSTNDNQLKPH